MGTVFFFRTIISWTEASSPWIPTICPFYSQELLSVKHLLVECPSLREEWTLYLTYCRNSNTFLLTQLSSKWSFEVSYYYSTSFICLSFAFVFLMVDWDPILNRSSTDHVSSTIYELGDIRWHIYSFLIATVCATQVYLSDSDVLLWRRTNSQTYTCGQYKLPHLFLFVFLLNCQNPLKNIHIFNNLHLLSTSTICVLNIM